MIRHLLFYFFVGTAFATACTGKTTQKIDHTYVTDMDTWRQQRLNDLTKYDGWPTLVGLYWLKEGVNTIGSGKENSIRFPKNLPAIVGEMELIEGKVTFKNNTHLGITVNGKEEESGVFQTDRDAQTTYTYWNSYQWHIIKRSDNFGIRLKDTLHPARFALKEIPAYPLKKSWRKLATFTKANSEATVAMENQVDMTIPYKIDGYLTFNHKGKKHQLIALDGGPKMLFVLISDKTTGVETYGGGRYMYVPRPNTKGETYLDFNQAINPPCVFTDFATCLLPPKENALPFRILAGEKMTGIH